MLEWKSGRYGGLCADTLKEWLHGQGIDLVGITRAEDLILAYPPRPATALLPTARSVIVMAVAHTLGSVMAPDIMLWTRSKMQTSRILDETAEKMGACWNGKALCPCPSHRTSPWRSTRPTLKPENGSARPGWWDSSPSSMRP